MKQIYCLSIFLTLFSLASFGQEVPFPTGPRDFNEITPWGHTDKGTNWDTSPYVPLIFQNTWFRFMPPNGVTYDADTHSWNYSDPTAKYPLILFFHGKGEKGDDNNNQLKHGGKRHRDAVVSGEFPGFLVYPQNQGPDAAKLLIDKILDEFPIDKNRIYVHGLSNGGKFTWEFLLNNPELVAAAAPMSAVMPNSYQEYLNYTPIRLAQGGKDKNPAPGYAQSIVDQFDENGANLEYFFFANLGHGTWNTMYNRSDFFSWFLERSKNTVHVLYDNREICPGDPIDVTMGFTPGFPGYEWIKDGLLIAGADSHELNVVEFGEYSGRLIVDGAWTEWSEPVTIGEKAATITPPIQTDILSSTVLPSPDGRTTVNLILPEGYEQYQWENADNSQVLGSSRILENVGVGNYRATVTEFGGCSSNYSDTFSVVDATGSDAPSSASNLRINIISKTSLELVWDQNPAPSFQETGFEIYRALTADGDFELVTIVGQNVGSYLDINLDAGTEYYYQVRAVNNNAAAPVSNMANASTNIDEQAPTAPGQLTVTATTNQSVSLEWETSFDNVGVVGYDIYVDGIKSYTTSDTTFTVFGLTEDQSYTFFVKARDLPGNESPFSNQVVSAAVFSGLNYKYFHGSWNLLPDFNTLTPVKTGQSKNVDISVREQNDNFAFYWEGQINIPVAGDYTFETRSDDGSKLYIGGYDESNLVVDNDGLHGSRYREGTYNFSTAGTYNIVITFFEKGGGQRMEVYWKNTAHGVTSRQLIPDSAFEGEIIIPGDAPVSPTNLVADSNSHDEVVLNWDDNSDDEQYFQIYRSDLPEEAPIAVGATLADDTTFTDNGLDQGTTYYYQVVALGEYGPSHVAEAPQRTLGTIRNGIGAQDNAVGSGYILYSAENVFNRFSANKPNSSNSDHLIAVRYNNGQWEYDNNSGYFNFSPRNSDVLLAAADFSNDIITGLEGVDSLIHGVKAGFVLGDLTFFADKWGNSNNDGEFKIEGSYFVSNLKNLVTVTTDNLPTVPLTPDSLVVTTITSNNTELSWRDNSSNEDSFEIYRSLGDSLNFQLVVEVVGGAGTSISYLDSGLFAHTSYFYKVRAKNLGGLSQFSNTISVSTLNTNPIITNPVDSIYLHHTESLSLQLIAEDADNDLIIINPVGLTSFMDFFDDGEGTGLLDIDPQLLDVGSYNLTIEVEDLFGGFTEMPLNVRITDNFKPVINPFVDVSVLEGNTETVVITATDVDSDSIAFSVVNQPNFVSFDSSMPGTITLNINPGGEDAGEYVVEIIADDRDGGTERETLNIVVLDNDPNFSMYLNFGRASIAQAPWNNLMASSATSGTVFDNLLNEDGFNTGYKLSLGSNWSGTQSTGGTTSSLEYPAEVSQSYFWTDNGPELLTLSGLNPTGVYDFKFFGSRNKSGDRRTAYSIGSERDTLDAGFNTSEIVLIKGVFPDENGEINIEVDNLDFGGGIFTVAYLNAIEMIVVDDGGVVPQPPTGLLANYIDNGGFIELVWEDGSENEVGFEIFASVGDTLNFVPIATTGADTTSWNDNSLSTEIKYYKLRAFNYRGNSEYSDIVSVQVPNQAPVITMQEEYQILAGDSVQFDFYVTDFENNELNISINGLPPFGEYTYDGDTTVSLTFTPTLEHLGIVTAEVVVSDADNQLNQLFNIQVSEKVAKTIFVNFAISGTPAASPWNNVIGAPNVGLNVNDLITAESLLTSFDIALSSSWAGGNSNGVVTGNDSGIFPDAVMETYFADNTNSVKTIVLSDLDQNKLYDLTFLASRKDVSDDRVTNFTVNGQTASVNARNNSTELAALSGVRPDSTGVIEIEINKTVGSPWAYINAMQIAFYPEPILPSTPTEFVSGASSKSEIKLNWIDNAANEDGFELYRSENGGSYILVTSLGANETSYIDNGLSVDTEYSYRIRAYNQNGYSLYANTEETTYKRSVFLNIGDESFVAPAPWNNTANYPFIGNEYNNLFDDSGLATGFTMTILGNSGGTTFTAPGAGGVNTGNDSGVYPDVVIQSYYWIEQSEMATVKFSNLNLNEQYDLEFFGSRTKEPRGTDFTINGKTVTLDVAFNTENTVKLLDVSPDVNGEIFLDMISMPGATGAHVGAIVLHASTTSKEPNAAVRRTDTENISVKSFDHNLNIYPNPLQSITNIEFKSKINETITLSIINNMGQEALRVEYEVSEGNNALTVNTESLKPGLYFMKILNRQNFDTIRKLIKN